MLTRWVNPLRFRFGTWRRWWRRRRAPVRRVHEPRRSEEVTVSVVVPVKNAGAELADLIARMNEQKGFRAVQVVVVDSGSTDGSAETAERLGATVVRIAPEEFSHSHARNLGAERAAGDYLLFTVQDALPSSERWLQEMFAGLRRHQAAAVSCAEAPRGDCDLFYRAISWNHERFLSAGGGDTVLCRQPDDTAAERRRSGQVSDTACLIGRELFLRYRHRGSYAEDLDLGLRLTADAYRLAFLTSTRIVHSHNRPAYYHLRRSYVEHLALLDMLPGLPAAPGDERSVREDIVASCAAIDGVVAGPLRALSAPCSPQQVREALAGDVPAAGTPPPASGDHLDARTRAFVAGLHVTSGDGGGRGAPGPDSLVAGVPAIGGLICAYLDHEGCALDAGLLEEFKAALYKGWAQHCGVRLASVYWRGPDSVRESMRALHEELTREV
jgi:GT2 family glycosyltransferase